MSLGQINRNLSPKQLGLFGLFWLIALGIFGRLVLRWTGIPWLTAVCWALAVLVPAAGALRPAVLRITYLAMAMITAPIGFIVSSTVLAVIYYFVVTPIGLFQRAAGRSSVARRFDNAATSHWIARKPDADPELYFRQF